MIAIKEWFCGEIGIVISTPGTATGRRKKELTRPLRPCQTHRKPGEEGTMVLNTGCRLSGAFQNVAQIQLTTGIDRMHDPLKERCVGQSGKTEPDAEGEREQQATKSACHQLRWSAQSSHCQGPASKFFFRV